MKTRLHHWKVFFTVALILGLCVMPNIVGAYESNPGTLYATDFEDGTTSRFQAASGSSFSLENGISHGDGNKCLLTNSRYASGVYADVSVEKATLYVISMWVNGTPNGPRSYFTEYACASSADGGFTRMYDYNLSTTFQARFYQTDWAQRYVTGHLITIANTEWHKVERAFYLSSDATDAQKQIRLCIGNQDNNSTGDLIMKYYMDDVYIGRVFYGLSGESDIEIPKTGTVNSAYKIDCLSAEYYPLARSIEWTIDGNPEGISVDSKGILTVNTEAETGVYTLRGTVTTDAGTEAFSKDIELVWTGEAVPIAKNLRINGIVELGEQIGVSYKYYHPFNTPEASEGSQIKWLTAETVNGAFTQIPGATGSTFTVTEAYLDKYIVAEITPLAEDGTAGSPVRTTVVRRAAPPVATQVKISGSNTVGSTLTGSYVYSDLNGDEESGSLYAWYIAGSPNGQYAKIEGANGLEYVIKASDGEKYIKFGVTPKNNTVPTTGEEAFSAPIIGPAPPTATDVTIEGSAKIGNTLYGKYKFLSENNVPEGRSKFKWYIGSRVVSENISLDITDDMEGAQVIFEVIPVAAIEPAVGHAVQSSPVKIAKAGTSGSFVKSGGGTVISNNNSSSNNNNNKNNNNISNPADVSKNDAFADIYGHWAAQSILNAVKAGIVKGVEDDLFMPDQGVTRAEFCAMLRRAFKTETYSENVLFEDVNEGDWYFEDIQSIGGLKIINGFEGLFLPNSLISRQEAAVIAMNLYIWKSDKQLEIKDAGQFADADTIAPWAANAVSAMSEIGIMKGIDGEFKPEESLTRAQSVVIIERLVEVLG